MWACVQVLCTGVCRSASPRPHCGDHHHQLPAPRHPVQFLASHEYLLQQIGCGSGALGHSLHHFPTFGYPATQASTEWNFPSLSCFRHLPDNERAALQPGTHSHHVGLRALPVYQVSKHFLLLFQLVVSWQTTAFQSVVCLGKLSEKCEGHRPMSS